MSEALDIARAFTEAIEARDAAALSRLYAEDALVWHSHDRIAEPKTQAVERAGEWFATLERVSVEVTARLRTEEGFVQEHLLTARALAAPEPAPPKPICIVATVRGGAITRLNEYISA